MTSTCTPRALRDPRRDENGFALMTSFLVLLITVVVVTGALQLATHTSQRSGLNRNQSAAVNAAEAGIEAALSRMSDGSCPNMATNEFPLPDQNLPTESYIIQAVPAATCTVNGPAVILATGYVPNATSPVAKTTMVAHINRSQGAPTSGGVGGYDFPNVLYTDGSLGTSASPAQISVFGNGGSTPSITANTGAYIGTSGSPAQLGGPVSSWGPVTLNASQIGGAVVGTDVTIKSATVQGAVAAVGNLSLDTVTVNGTATYGGSYSHNGTVTVASGGAPTSAPTIEPLRRPFPAFTNDSATIGSPTGLGVGSATTSCPPSASAWTAPFYDIATSCAVAYSPGTYSSTAANKSTVIIAQGPLTVNVPPTAVGGQLYVITTGGGSLTINGSGSTLPVFAFTDGALNLNGSIVGQFVGHSVATTGATTLTFTPPATPAPNFAFPAGYTLPNLGTTFVSTVSFEYQCAGAVVTPC
jgi:type II secretory pathway pseudopilin PulG